MLRGIREGFETRGCPKIQRATLAPSTDSGIGVGLGLGVVGPGRVSAARGCLSGATSLDELVALEHGEHDGA